MFKLPFPIYLMDPDEWSPFEEEKEEMPLGGFLGEFEDGRWTRGGVVAQGQASACAPVPMDQTEDRAPPADALGGAQHLFHFGVPRKQNAGLREQNTEPTAKVSSPTAEVGELTAKPGMGQVGQMQGQVGQSQGQVGQAQGRVAAADRRVKKNCRSPGGNSTDDIGWTAEFIPYCPGGDCQHGCMKKFMCPKWRRTMYDTNGPVPIEDEHLGQCFGPGL